MYLIDEVKEQQEYAYTKSKRTNSYKALDNKNKVRKETLSGFLDALIHASRHSAKVNSYKFNIGSNFLYELYKKQNGLCALSGIKLTILSNRTKRINNFNISIDRIDSSKGYTKDNIHLVCASINVMKLDHSTKEFVDLCKAVANYNA